MKLRPKRMREFYADTIEAMPASQPIGMEPVKFWRAAFAVRFGAQSSRDRASSTRGNISDNLYDQGAARKRRDGS